MKAKALLFAAALIALSACNNIFENDNLSDGNSFKKGEKVTIRVSAGELATKVTGTDDGTYINFKWDSGDKILVKVDDSSAEFRLTSGGGSAEATFTGIMPSDGDEFDVQYPIEIPGDISSQTYAAGKVPAGMMSFSATECTLDETSNLSADNSVLQLNLTGSQAISKIIVETVGADSDKSYTLTTSGVTLSSTATAFYVVTDKIEEKLKVTVYDNSSSEICNFTTSNEIDLSGENVCVNMPVKKVATFYPGTEEEGININGVVWAPVNCGYDATHTYGLLYQWGRKYGQGYDGESPERVKTKFDSGFTTHVDSDINNKNTFYWKNGNNWYAGSNPDNLWDTTGGSSSDHTPTKSDYDPCPTGWRVPTFTELCGLVANHSAWTANAVGGVTQSGFWFSGSTAYSDTVPRVFFPAAGYIDAASGNSYSRNDANNGFRYWSSSVTNSGTAYSIYSSLGTAVYTTYDGRCVGFAVRCVQE